jgi:hypothetical protein
MRDSSTLGTGAVAARTVGVRQARGPAMITAVTAATSHGA